MRGSLRSVLSDDAREGVWYASNGKRGSCAVHTACSQGTRGAEEDNFGSRHAIRERLVVRSDAENGIEGGLGNDSSSTNKWID